LSVSETQRRALQEAARTALGEEEGDTLMALFPAVNTELATRQDVERAQERLGARLAAMDERLDERLVAMDERFDARLVAMDERFHARLVAMDERFDARLAVTAAELRAHTWKVVVGTGVALSLAMGATMLAGAGLLLRILDAV
jgi:hypothetical protein